MNQFNTLDPGDYHLKAMRLAVLHENKRFRDDDTNRLAIDETFVVWSSKTLQNWKVIIGTSRPDDMLYEVTYNGDKKEAYVDSYKKWENSVYPDDQEATEE